MHACMHAWMHACMYVCMYVCIARCVSAALSLPPFPSAPFPSINLSLPSPISPFLPSSLPLSLSIFLAPSGPSLSFTLPLLYHAHILSLPLVLERREWGEKARSRGRFELKRERKRERLEGKERSRFERGQGGIARPKERWGERRKVARNGD